MEKYIVQYSKTEKEEKKREKYMERREKTSK